MSPPQVDPEPFEQVVAAHGAAVLRVCRALVGPLDADDAWSETFLSALRAYPRLRPGSDVRAWLLTIAHHRSVDQLRRRNRSAVPVGDPPEVPSVHDLPADAVAAWLDDELVDALDRLPPKQRAAVLHHHLGGLPYAEVAALVGGSEAAARRSAADGIARLRELRAARPSHDTTAARRL